MERLLVILLIWNTSLYTDFTFLAFHKNKTQAVHSYNSPIPSPLVLVVVRSHGTSSRHTSHLKYFTLHGLYILSVSQEQKHRLYICTTHRFPLPSYSSSYAPMERLLVSARTIRMPTPTIATIPMKAYSKAVGERKWEKIFFDDFFLWKSVKSSVYFYYFVAGIAQFPWKKVFDSKTSPIWPRLRRTNSPAIRGQHTGPTTSRGMPKKILKLQGGS